MTFVDRPAGPTHHSILGEPEFCGWRALVASCDEQNGSIFKATLNITYKELNFATP